MILSKLVIKTILYNFILNNHVIAVYFREKSKWIYWRQGDDVSDDVTTTKGLRRVNDKMF